jgi:uncharacterized protein YkwD
MDTTMECKTFILTVLLLLFSGTLTPCSAGTGSSSLPECRVAAFEALPADADHTFALEMELLALTNQVRSRDGLPPLLYDEHLTRIAREHSNGMARQGFISHDRPSGPLQTRLDRAGYLYNTAKENVASASTIQVAHRSFLASPKHKDNIVSTDITHIGIGLVRHQPPCDRYLYVTALFASPREPYQPSMVEHAMRNRIHALQQQGSGAMEPDPLLEQIASQSALSLSLPYDSEGLRNLLAESANTLQQNGTIDVSRLEVGVQLIRNPGNLKLPPAPQDKRHRRYGWAVRQVLDKDQQPGFLVLTLVGTVGDRSRQLSATK